MFWLTDQGFDSQSINSLKISVLKIKIKLNVKNFEKKGLQMRCRFFLLFQYMTSVTIQVFGQKNQPASLTDMSSPAEVFRQLISLSILTSFFTLGCYITEKLISTIQEMENIDQRHSELLLYILFGFLNSKNPIELYFQK